MANVPTQTQNDKQQMTPEQRDALATNLILSRQKLRQKTLGVFSLKPGETIDIKMLNVGLLVGVKYLVRAIGTTADAIISGQGNQGAFPLLSRVQFVDIDGTARHNTTPYEIFLINSLNAQKTQGIDLFENTGAYPQSNYGKALQPNGIGGGTGMFNASFYQTLPLCLHWQGDLRGAINLQSVNGDAYLQVTANTLSGIFSSNSEINDETVFKHDLGSIALLAPVFEKFEIEVVQEYYTIDQYPLVSGNFIALPEISARTVYSIEGAVKTSDNISPNGEKQISFPNNRNIRNAVFTYFNTKMLGGSRDKMVGWDDVSEGDVKRVKFLTGAGDYVEDLTSKMWLANQQDTYNTDLGRGVYAMDFRRSPASSSVFGTMQAVFAIGASVSNAKFGTCFESHYMKGAALSNVTQ